MVCMYCFGERRSAIFSAPRASRSRSRWRIFSRSTPTDFIRLPSVSVAISGIASVSTVAIAAMAENTIAIRRGFRRESIKRSITPPSEIEIDHFLHDHHADPHPDRAAHQHDAAERLGPKQRDVFRT